MSSEINRVPFTGTLQEFKAGTFFYGHHEEGVLDSYFDAECTTGDVIIERLADECFKEFTSTQCAFTDNASTHIEIARIYIAEVVPLPVLDAEWLAETLFDDYFTQDDDFHFSLEIAKKIDELNKMISAEVKPLWMATSAVIDEQSIFRLLLDEGVIRWTKAGGI
jgi:hypothetical protein